MFSMKVFWQSGAPTLLDKSEIVIPSTLILAQLILDKFHLMACGSLVVGQILNAVIPSITEVAQPIFCDSIDNERFGVDGGALVALIVIDFVLVVWPGALKVSIAVYVPEGKVTGKGVILLSFEREGVPVPVNCQLTFVEELIPLPVETNENRTVEPAQTSRVLLDELYWGLVTKLALNCPQAELPKVKTVKNKMNTW